MAKLIVCYGKPGSGTTTFAVNLAVALGEMNKRVCILSSEADCGELQIFFNEKVGSEKGFDKARNSSIGLFQDKVVNCQTKGVDIIPVADSGAEKLGETLMSESLDILLETINVTYSYIIIDAAASTFNSITTYYGLFKNSSMFFCLHKPARTTELWYNAHKQLFDIYDKKPIHVVTNLSFAISIEDYMKMMPAVNFSFKLPFIAECDEYENMGTPIVTVKKTKNKNLKVYKNIMSEIAEFVCESAGKPKYTRTLGGINESVL